MKPLTPRLNLAHGLADGLILADCFPMGGGLIFSEQGPTSRPGTSAGTLAWTASQYGHVPKFNGTDTVISYGTTPFGSTRLSVCVLWKQANNTPIQFDGIAGRTNGGTWSQGFGMFWDSPVRRMKFFIEGYNTNFAYFDVPAADIWHYYVGTWDGATVKLYVDGIPGTSDPYSGSITYANLPVEVGRLGTNSFNPPGECADFKIYNRALLPAEVMNLTLDPWQMFRSPLPASVRPPVAAAGQPTMRRWGGVPGMVPAGARMGRTW